MIDVLTLFSFVAPIALFCSFILNVVVSRRTARTELSSVYFDLADRWSIILDLLYDVRTHPPKDLEALEQQYPNHLNFMATDEWRSKYRPICNFFEDVGLLVYNKNIDVGTVGVLVTVSEDDYFRLKPVLEYLRKHYRDDIYIFWNYLLEETKKNKPLRPYTLNSVYEPNPSNP